MAWRRHLELKVVSILSLQSLFKSADENQLHLNYGYTLCYGGTLSLGTYAYFGVNA